MYDKALVYWTSESGASRPTPTGSPLCGAQYQDWGSNFCSPSENGGLLDQDSG